MSRIARAVALCAVVGACMSPSTSSTGAKTIGASDAENRDVAAALAARTARAYQTLLTSPDARLITGLPSLADSATSIRTVEGTDGALITVIGPYHDARTGRATVTRLSVRRDGDRVVGTWFTRGVGTTDSSRGDFTPMQPVRVSAN